MNKCKLCKKSIPDGAEYCNECISKKDFATDESYLDNLLNSVLEETVSARDVYKKQSDHEEDSDNGNTTSENTVDLADLYDFEQFDITEDLDEQVSINAVINSEDIFGEAIMTENNSDTYEDANNADISENTGIAVNINDYEDRTDMIKEDNFSDLYNNIDTEFLQVDRQNDDFNSDEHRNENDYGEDEEASDLPIDELIKQFDLAVEDTSSYDTGLYSDVSDEDLSKINVNSNYDMEKKGTDDLRDNNLTPEDELLSLLNQFDPDDPVASDIQSITELLGGLEQELKNDDYSYFADNADPVSTNIKEEVQDDKKEPDNGIKYITPDFDEEENIHKKSKKKGKKAKNKEEEPKEKKGILQRLFGNVKEDKDDISFDKQETFFDETEENDDIDDKKYKKKKKKTGKKAASLKVNDKEDITFDDGDSEAEEKKKAKKVKKEKKKKKKKEKVVVIEEEIDEGRINKAGAAIVFLFFGIITTIIIVTTNGFSYRQNISNASRYFDMKEYAQAYDKIMGLDIKDEDIELYNKIKTVMIVHKQLESYYNYYDLKMFPEALDSLLKGLKRYEKYIELATLLGINEDLDYIRSQIVEELYHVFSMTEEEALDIINIENQADYTEAVYEAVHDIMAYY
ncbi:MAG TPA: hypothetical protein PK304_00850 [Mobilitalea sp.]|nr:hypothetical protein [Mobilitalea sp.]